MGNIKAKTHLEKLGFMDPDKKNPIHQKIQTWAYDNIETILKETVMANNSYPFKIFNNKWEHPVVYEKGSYKLLVGFIDLFVQISGTFDIKDHYGINYRFLNIFIEIKSEIPDLGELIRQMRAYQTYVDHTETPIKYLIISPDDSHCKILNEQGFYFYKYKDPSLLF
jgi:hypothetical protein